MLQPFCLTEVTWFWKRTAPVLMEMLRWSLSAPGISSFWSDKLKISPDVTEREVESKERHCLILGSKWVFQWGASLSSTDSSLIIKKDPRSLLSSIQAGFYLLEGWAPFFGAVVNLRNIKTFLATYLFPWNICLHWEKPYGQLWMLKLFFFYSLHQGFFFSFFGSGEATKIFPSYITSMHCSDLL